MRTGIGPDEFGADHSAGANRGSKILPLVNFIAALENDIGQFNVISVNGSLRAEKGLIHFDSPPHLDGAYWVRGYRLVHVRQPGEIRRSSAGTALGHTVGFDGPGSLKNLFVYFRHGPDRILRGLVMVLWVVARRDCVNVV